MSDLKKFRVGLYIEADSLGVTERDAAQRAAGSLYRANHPLYRHGASGEMLEDGSVLTITYAEPLGDAMGEGLIRIVPRFRLDQLKSESGETS